MSKYVKGSHNAICDICSFQYKRNQMRKTWNNLLVCKTDYEEKHPQLTIRVPPESISVKDARPERMEVLHVTAAYRTGTVIDADGNSITVFATVVNESGASVVLEPEVLDEDGNEFTIFAYDLPYIAATYPQYVIMPPPLSPDQLI